MARPIGSDSVATGRRFASRLIGASGVGASEVGAAEVGAAFVITLSAAFLGG